MNSYFIFKIFISRTLISKILTFRILLTSAAACGLLILSPRSLAEPCPAPQATSTASPARISARTPGTHAKTQGIVNFGEVTPNLYRGGLPSPAGLQSLKKLGVSVVVDMRGSANKIEETTVTGLGMQYISIPSHCPFPSDKPWARFLSVMQENAGKKVFVHCRLGDDRTGMAVAAYRMAEQGWSPEQAMNEMRAFGFTGVHHAICMGMAHYEQTFPKHLKTRAAFRNLGPGNETSK